jgi:asparagine synthase (glutamine-hydrolysing)
MMCGIAGIYNYLTKEPVNSRLLQDMSDLIAHRGPDDHGIYVNRQIGLAHRRLSIIDLSPSGHQPLSNQDGTIWITYNGECYNYRQFFPQLRNRGHVFKSSSDTEVILHLYEEYGLEFLNRLDGMFAFALWDGNRQRLVLARDRLGIKPLFYYHDGKKLLFASELKALLADPSIPRQINHGALGDYFRYMSIPDPESIFKGIRKLLPGCCLVVENDRVEERQYWDLKTTNSHSTTNIGQTREEFIQHFQEAVTSHMIADVPVGAFLSGGVDSSAIVAFASQNKENVRPLNTFSITFKGSGEFDESSFAAQVAQRYHTDHREFDLTPDLISALPKIVWHADEPFAVSSAFALYFLSELTSRYTKVVMSGDGGDEVFAGYPWRHWTEPRFPAWLIHPVIASLNRLGFDRLSKTHDFYQRGRNILLRSTVSPSAVYAESITCFLPAELASMLTSDAWQAIQHSTRDNMVHHYYDYPEDATTLTRKLYTDLKTTLVSEMLTKVDRMTMAFGLEARVPFLDHRLVEWAFRLPDNHKLRGFEGKYVVKKALEKYLPRDLIYRTKHGFNVPLRIWMRDQLQEMTRDMLSSRQLRERGLFQPDAVQKLVDNHFNGTRDHSDQIFVLMVLELWFQHYVDRPLIEK